MPTKPSLGAYVWATDVNYTTGPAPLIGTATKITPPLAESDEGWKATRGAAPSATAVLATCRSQVGPRRSRPTPITAA